MKIDNKERVLFWLRRREKALDAVAIVDQERLAQVGASYTQRSAAVEQAEKAAEAVKGELESLRETIRFITENAV